MTAKKVILDDKLTINIMDGAPPEKIEEACRCLRWMHEEFGTTEATVYTNGVGYHELYFQAIAQLLEKFGPEGYTSGGIPVYKDLTIYPASSTMKV